jgi:uracil-DNA glycosylase
MHPSWKTALAAEFRKEYFTKLVDYVVAERRNYTVYPAEGDVFTAMKETPFEDVKVVILGQDPYHGPGQAHGLSFSVKKGVALPPSLMNIYKELETDVKFRPPGHGCLLEWAQRGVLLLNTTLTVRAHEPASHQGHGWEDFTDAAIRALSARQRPVVFILWGAHARQKGQLIDRVRHSIFESVHPSPRSVFGGFFGSRPFSSANQVLEITGLGPIDWQLTP